jgi:charged multivesicular body protein 4
MWGTLFGGGAAANKKKQDAAKNSIVKLREQVNMLEKKEAHLQKQKDDLTATAKRNVTTNKKGILHPSPSPVPTPLCSYPVGVGKLGGTLAV